LEKRIKRIDKKTVKVMASLKHQRHMLDTERDVCLAFVMFNEEPMKYEVTKE
jgi:hypothetical protein